MTVTNLFQLNMAAYLSQELNEYFMIGGSLSGVNIFRSVAVRPTEDDPVGTNLTLQPQEIDLQLLATYSFLEFLNAGFAYNLYCSAILENEPTTSLSLTVPFGIEWFSLSATVSGSYYFSIYGNGFGANAVIQPQFTVPAWALSVAFPVGLSFMTEGYKNSEQTGLDSFFFSVSMQWMFVQGIALTGSFGYAPSLMLEQDEVFSMGEPNYQVGIVFMVLA